MNPVYVNDAAIVLYSYQKPSNLSYAQRPLAEILSACTQARN